MNAVKIIAIINILQWLGLIKHLKCASSVLIVLNAFVLFIL